MEAAAKWQKLTGGELRTVDNDGDNEIKNHKYHDEDVDVVPKVSTDSVEEPYLKTNVTICYREVNNVRTKGKLHAYIHECSFSKEKGE